MADSNSKLEHLLSTSVSILTSSADLLTRVKEAEKDALRRAAKKKERDNDRKAKLEAVDRHAEKVNEEEEAMLPGIEAGAAHEAVKDAQEEQDFDDDDVPILQQVLFEATLTPASEFSLPEEDNLLQACRAALRRRTEFEAIDASAAFSELVSNKMMVMYYQRHPDCPEATARALFQATACCEDARLAQRSLRALATLCGFGDEAAMAGIRDVPPIESGIYGKSGSSLRVCKWMPGADDFLEALVKLGYRVPSMGPSSKRGRGAKGASKALAQQAPYAGPLPQLAHLTCLLRLLGPICEAQAQAGGARGPAWSRFSELFLALLHLMADPAACHLSLDLQAALEAALGAFQDSMWERRFADLAAGAASAGCSPGGALAAIRAIPAACQRGRLLQRHALAALLRRAIPGRDAHAAEGRRRGGVADIDVPKELDKLAWFSTTKGVASLVADAMKEDGGHSLSDVAVALQAAHLLMWQHEVEHGGDDLVCEKWPKFLSSLQAQLVKYKQDTFPGLSSLKLLVTRLMDFPRVADA